MNKTIIVKGNEIVLFSKNEEDYISLTHIATYKNYFDILWQIAKR